MSMRLTGRNQKLALLGGAILLVALCVGIYHGSFLYEERRRLRALPTAHPEEVIGSYFWAVNNGSEAVLRACLYHKDREYHRYVEPTLRVLHIGRGRPETSYHLYQEGKVKYLRFHRVKFAVSYPFSCEDDPTLPADVVEWDFVLVKRDAHSPWLIADWGH